MNHKLMKIDYHRNGVCGEGFHVAIVESEVELGDVRKMLCVTFGANQEGEAGAYRTAVFDMALLAQDVIEFTQNSWRGDRWHPFICETVSAENQLTDEERYPLIDWQDEVRAGDTKLGYAEWIQHRKESEEINERAPKHSPEVQTLIQAVEGLLRYCVTPQGFPDKDKGRTEDQQRAFDAARSALAPFTESSPEPLRPSQEDAPFFQKAMASEGGCCPCCGKDELEGDSWEFQAGMVWQKVTCLYCESSWDENYTFRDITDVVNLTEEVRKP